LVGLALAALLAGCDSDDPVFPDPPPPPPPTPLAWDQGNWDEVIWQ
jgi:hypothetical protein